MSSVQYWDGVNRLRKAPKRELMVLEERDKARHVVESKAEKYKALKAELEKEEAKPHRNNEWIQKCRAKMDLLKSAFESVQGKVM